MLSVYRPSINKTPYVPYLLPLLVPGSSVDLQFALAATGPSYVQVIAVANL